MCNRTQEMTSKVGMKPSRLAKPKRDRGPWYFELPGIYLIVLYTRVFWGTSVSQAYPHNLLYGRLPTSSNNQEESAIRVQRTCNATGHGRRWRSAIQIPHNVGEMFSSALG